ncbi:MAG: hypothetical protein ABIP81_04595 [Terriglobales bacterium]
MAAPPAPLPPAAQEVVKLGIIAAGVPDYLLAIRYFEEARKLAPQAPVVYLNLGLAESKLAGRELRAIAWLGAYLAAYPDAPNAKAVKEHMDVLAVTSQSNLTRLVRSVQEAANQASGPQRKAFLSQIPVLWSLSGDTATALRTVDLLEGDVYKNAALSEVAAARAWSGDIDGAQTVAARIQDPKYKSEALAVIAKAQGRAGDVAGAQKTAAQMKSAISKAYEPVAIGPTPVVNNEGWAATDDWLKKLDDSDPASDCPLNSAPFLDMAGYLKSLPSDDPGKLFMMSAQTARSFAWAQAAIYQRVKQHPVLRGQQAAFGELQAARKKAGMSVLILDSPDTALGAGGLLVRCIFYRPGNYRGSAARVGVFIDDKMAVNLVNGRWVELMLPAGHHVLKPKGEVNGLEINLQPGRTYYFRAEWVEQGMFKNMRKEIHYVPLEETQFAIDQVKKLKPLGDGDIHWGKPAPIGSPVR